MSWGPLSLRTASHGIVFEGEASPAPGGGSMPGGLGSADVIFTEQPTAGVYTSEPIPVLAGTLVLDVLGFAIAGPWAADTAILDGGDNLNGPQAYAQTITLVGGTTGLYGPYSPSNGSMDGLAVSRAAIWLGSYNTSFYGLAPASTSPDSMGVQDAGAGVLYDADDEIVFTVTTTIAVEPVVPAGILRIKVVYLAPVTPTNGVFA